MRQLFKNHDEIISSSASIKILGGKGRQKIFLGGKNVKKKKKKKKHVKYTKICHFSVKIVKFGLIVTNLKLFWGKTGGGTRKYFGEAIPHSPLWHCHWNYKDILKAVHSTFKGKLLSEVKM